MLRKREENVSFCLRLKRKEEIRKGEDNQREREEKGTEMEKKMGISAGRSLRLRGVYDGMRGREI